MSRYCCDVCPHAITCRDLDELAFARPDDLTDFFDEPDAPEITLQRPVCPSCHLELPVSGVCEECSG